VAAIERAGPARTDVSSTRRRTRLGRRVGDQLAALARLAAERGLYVVHDEVLDCFAVDRRTAGAHGRRRRDRARQQRVERFGVTGWRIVLVPMSFVSEAAKAQTYLTLASPPAQEAVAAASTPRASTTRSPTRAALRRNGELLPTGCGACPALAAARPPDGGFTCSSTAASSPPRCLATRWRHLASASRSTAAECGVASCRRGVWAGGRR